MKKFTNILNEKIYINKDTINKSILFTDIIKSAEKWKDSKNDMMLALEEQSIRFDFFCKKHNGFIIKTIGDAYMVSFDTIKDSIEFAINIQKDLKENPIKVKNNNIKIRIGISYGPVYDTIVQVQNKSLIDFLGYTVNLASRIESNVCNPGNVTFASHLKNINIKDILKDYSVDVIRFKNEDNDVKRSARLLTDVQRYYYKDIEELKGINEIDVYHINL